MILEEYLTFIMCVLRVPGLFAVGLFAVGHFAVGHFAVRTLRRTDTSS